MDHRIQLVAVAAVAIHLVVDHHHHLVAAIHLVVDRHHRLVAVIHSVVDHHHRLVAEHHRLQVNISSYDFNTCNLFISLLCVYL